MTSLTDCSAGTIVRQLMGHIDFTALKEATAAALDALCKQYLGVDNLMIDGKFTNRLPEDFDLSVIETVCDAFQLRLDEYDDKGIAAVEGQRIAQEIEKYVADGLIDDKQTLSKALKFELEDSAREYAAAPLFANKEDLMLDYENAKQITFVELFAGNMDDIFAFRNTLENYVRARCENLMFKKLGRLYVALAETL